jgi:hypothetical protein
MVLLLVPVAAVLAVVLVDVVDVSVYLLSLYPGTSEARIQW